MTFAAPPFPSTSSKERWFKSDVFVGRGVSGACGWIDQCSAPQYWYPVHKVSSIEAFAQMNGENSRVIPWHRTFSLQNGFSTMN